MRIYKLLTAAGLAGVLCAGSVFAVTADEIEIAENEVAADQAELDALRNTISDLETQQAELTGEIDDLQTKLVTTISGVEDLNRQIDNLTVQMGTTASDLVTAEEERDVQYDAMKKRIQYLYENGGDAGWASVFLGGGNISDILDKAEYTQQMYDYDRKQLDEYLSSIQTVESLQTQQREEQSTLQSRKREQEEAQLRLESLISEAEEEYDDYDEQIADANAKADEYLALIEAKNEAIAQLIAMQEAMGVSSEEAVYVAQQIVDSYEAENGVAYPANNGNAYPANNGTAYTENAGNDSAGTGAYSSYTQAARSSATGQAILAYAQQFLGNSYVYGGNSLTNGVDCSGFVQQVYKNFGINTSRTSWDIESDGQEVSFNDIQIGDVLCYSGHVGIYAGDGQIINAIDEDHGIGYSDMKADQIRTIRRYVEDDSYSEAAYTEDTVSGDVAVEEVADVSTVSAVSSEE